MNILRCKAKFYFWRAKILTAQFSYTRAYMWMYTAATINRFKPAGWPRQFLLQLVSDLTSNFDRFLLF